MTTPTLTKLTDVQIHNVIQNAIMEGISHDVESPVELAELYGYSLKAENGYNRQGAIAKRFKAYGQKMHRLTGVNIITINFPRIAAKADYAE